MARRRKVERGLNAMQLAFCSEYMVDFNGQKAAERAGYSPKTATMQASRMLSQDKIQARVAELRQKQQERLEITADDVLTRIWAAATADMSQYMTVDDTGAVRIDMSQCTREQLAQLTELTQDVQMTGDPNDSVPILKTRIKLVDKLRALDMAAKMLGAYAPERHALTDTQGNDIDTDPRELLRARMDSIAARLPAQDGTGRALPGPDAS